MSDLLQKINKIKTKNKTNYLHQVRYPFYKKLQHNSIVTFESPFTALVGPNGSGKSSVLTSLYGSVRGKSIGDFWFSTELDPISDDGDTPRVIHKFIPEGMEESVEVIKMRVRSARTGARKNPDYWETARPRLTDDMQKMPDEITNAHQEHRNESRWKAINKAVVYIDFRSELCAFDISFYFNDMKKNRHYTHVQDFLRDRSRSLKQKLSTPSKLPSNWFSQTVGKIENLNENELFWANKILGKRYISAKRISHTMFDNKGFSILFNDGSNQYSEAVAGSGEVAIINCVCKVLSAPRNSLILLDEPEVSLHPGAQTELRNLLFSAITDNNVQVVISTHSEHFLKGLSSKSIKLFQQDPNTGRYNILNECTPEQAFCRLGGTLDINKKIFVEDELAKIVVEAALDDIDSSARSQFDVIPYPGGADTIIKQLPVHFAAIEDTSNDIVLLDGDKQCSVFSRYSRLYKDKIENKKLIIKRTSSDIATSEYRKINGILSEQTGINGSTFILPLNGGDAPNEAEEISLKLKILDKYHEKFHFMNTETPEELVWEIATGTIPNIYKNKYNDLDYKERFELSAIDLHGKDETNSDTILQLQKIYLRNRNKESVLWTELLNNLKRDLQLI
ncbi:ATP-binding protein [Aliivibrio sp. S3MY1]|uniref:ATP-dependent nuclease n=1 Tax=unclassified Aliivibrio TaxID=2645654 RepID=UPI002379A5A4|nr:MULTISPECIES: ATP-binding protein [unclassified Aliivibrio]MDD9194218.1 ATP-binding protein [Aliivibrio sp. S3MY1]MDD9197885.1 ATP-binding protein [Aliivibrio sp. S2MY1]